MPARWILACTSLTPCLGPARVMVAAQGHPGTPSLWPPHVYPQCPKATVVSQSRPNRNHSLAVFQLASSVCGCAHARAWRRDGAGGPREPCAALQRQLS